LRQNKLDFLYRAALCTLAALFVFVSCKETKIEDEVAVVLSVPKTSLENTEGQQFINVSAGSYWVLSLTFPEGEAWAEVDQTEGKGSAAGLIFTYSANETTETRTCALKLICGDKTSEVTVTQQAGEKKEEKDETAQLRPDKVTSWLELPATDHDGRFFFTRNMTIKSGDIRNYSFYLDTAAKVSVWVAYPLNSVLMGSGSRTNEWGIDPKVPEKYQAVIAYGAFRGGYQRGHQIPSADRLDRDANVTTFYGTNMTPQRGELNEKVWAALEGKVRDCSRQVDTLYVVTGADIEGSTEYAFDNMDKKITVPVGYYKALLGYKKDRSIGSTTGGYFAIGFYFEHKGYADDDIKAQSMSIAELEKKIGYDLFVNLPAKVGEDTATKVESTVDSWWYKTFNR
jgi:DNA/RNA endonuclease G (NUC1)